MPLFRSRYHIIIRTVVYLYGYVHCYTPNLNVEAGILVICSIFSKITKLFTLYFFLPIND